VIRAAAQFWSLPGGVSLAVLGLRWAFLPQFRAGARVVVQKHNMNREFSSKPLRGRCWLKGQGSRRPARVWAAESGSVSIPTPCERSTGKTFS